MSNPLEAGAKLCNGAYDVNPFAITRFLNNVNVAIQEKKDKDAKRQENAEKTLNVSELISAVQMSEREQIPEMNETQYQTLNTQTQNPYLNANQQPIQQPNQQQMNTPTREERSR